jgi:hypothetical protein
MIEVSWRWLQETFGFEAPQQSKKEVPWHLKFDGDLRWLDLRGMLESIGYRARPIGGKDAVFCPWRAEHKRSLGANTGKSDLLLPNEMEYSLSAQVGLKYREDFERRMRQIELAFPEEDANKRKFESARLHEEILERRSESLSAVAALYRNWAERGFPKGPTTFTSYLEWAEVVGGVMVAAGLQKLKAAYAGSREWLAARGGEDFGVKTE